METVAHVVVDCPRLREARQQLRNKVGDAFNSIASMLGGDLGTSKVRQANVESTEMFLQQFSNLQKRLNDSNHGLRQPSRVNNPGPNEAKRSCM
jgi:hypothetical protein